MLRAAGEDGLEAFVLWSGIVTDQVCAIRSVHVPEQHSVRTREGLHVTIAGSALHDLAVAVAGQGELLAVQVHTHPESAYHSDADDALAVVTKRGGLSLVVPRFAAHGLRGADVAILRLETGGWVPVARAGVASLLRFDGRPWH